MPIYIDFIIFAISIAIIIKSADFFTSGAAGLAQALRIPRLIIGLTIVSLATSAPEFTISAFSSYMGHGGMAVGNVLGSCLANIGLALAVAAMVKAIHFPPKLIKQELTFSILVSIFLFLLMLDRKLGRGDGLFLSVLLIGSFAYLIRRELRERGKKSEDHNSLPSLKKDILKFSVGAIGVIASARYGIIPSGINIARFLRVPEIVIGLSMVAVGTSLPELFTALVAVRKKMGDLAAGTVIGSNILNILWVLGSSCLINPLTIDSQTIWITMPVMLFISVVMLLFARSNFSLIRRESFFLFLIYLSYIIYLFKFAY